jgi:hypothetical protein
MIKQNHDNLEVYLRDHYAGAVGATELLEHLIKAYAGEKKLESFFSQLATEVKQDQASLHKIMEGMGIETSAVHNAGAWVAEKFGRIKLGFGGDEKGGIRLLQALEALAVGITGKILLWRALEVAPVARHYLKGADFDLLKARAEEQLERVEGRRLQAAEAALDE